MFENIKTPCYVIDEGALVRNLEILSGLQERTGCRVLLAQKAFSMYSLYPLIGKYLCGTAASGLYEAKLGREEMRGKEVHVFSPAYSKSDFGELINICDHIVFNSPSQWLTYKDLLPATVSGGLRVNPQHSTQQHGIYDPCSEYSRLGAVADSLKALSGDDLSGLEGLHFHTLCEQDADALAETLDVVLDKFGYLFDKNTANLKWVNFGGGHHITKDGYNMDLLERCIKRVQDLGVTVYLEPGEAVALNAGCLVTEVQTVVENGCKIAVLDASAACHYPDVIEMPYTPRVVGAKAVSDINADTTIDGYNHQYILAGNTCLAGDITGRYAFKEPVTNGTRIVFEDMAIYTMVKNNTFNGMPLPSIAVLKCNGEIKIVKEFGYEDFKNRL